MRNAECGMRNAECGTVVGDDACDVPVGKARRQKSVAVRTKFVLSVSLNEHFTGCAKAQPLHKE